MRNIKELRKIPISEMTDEEIVKAVMDRMQSKTAMVAYVDEDNRWIFLWRYKSGFFHNIKLLKEHIEKWFGCKLTKIGEEE